MEKKVALSAGEDFDESKTNSGGKVCGHWLDSDKALGISNQPDLFREIIL